MSDGPQNRAGEETDIERLFDRLVALAIREKRISSALAQSHLQIGYNKAARLIELMEDRGIVGKPNQLGKRAVLISKAPASRAKDFAPDGAGNDDQASEGRASTGLGRAAAAVIGAPAFVPSSPHPTTDGSDEEAEPSQMAESGEGASPASNAQNGGGGDAYSRAVLVRKMVRDTDKLQRAVEQPLNDVGNAARMKIWFGDDLLYVLNVGWHSWEKTHWDWEKGKQKVILAAQMIGPLIEAEANLLSWWPYEEKILEREAVVLAKPEEDRDKDDKQALIDAAKVRASFANRKKQRRDYGKSSGNTGKVKAMIEQLEPHVTVTVDVMDADPLAFNVQNGTLHFSKVQLDDWEEGKPQWRMKLKFSAHNRADRITKVAPVDYDPAAQSPKWLAFVNRFLPEDNVRRYAQTFHGLGLTGMMVQALIYHYGNGANGKSVFIQTIANVVGPYLFMLPVEALSGEGQRRSDQASPEFARLPGARVVRVSELEKGFKLKEALIKSLTGGEPILTRHLNQSFFEFLPVFKAVLSSNHKPEIYGTDKGIWRRMNLVHWSVTIPDEEQREFPIVVAEMVAEGSGVLNWLIEGTGIYLAEGLRAPPEVQSATLEHRSDMDPVARFVTHCVHVHGVPLAPDEEPPVEYRVGAREMREAFNRWMEANGQRTWGETAFGRQMAERAREFGFQRFDKRVRYFGPVSLHDVPLAAEAAGGKHDQARADRPPDDGWEPPGM